MRTFLKNRTTWNFSAIVAFVMIASSCNPLVGDPTSQIAFNPGVSAMPPSTPAPFTTQINFANSSQFTSSTGIDFSNGVAEFTPANQSDNSTNSFAGGHSTGTTYLAATTPSPAMLVLDHSGTANDLGLDASWTPAWPNLVGYWPFDGSGNVGATVSATVGSNFTLNHSGGAASTYVSGQIGQGINFAGTTDSLITPLATAQTTNVTMSAWVNWNGTAAKAFILYNGDETVGGYGIFLNDGGCNSGSYIGILESNVTCDAVGSSYSLPANVWTYLTITHVGTTWSLYANGILIKTGTSTPAATVTSTYVGFSQWGSTYIFPGAIDEPAIWNTALSASAIQSIYQHQKSKYAGTFESRVMDGITTTANWTNFSWTSTLPFLKALPDTANPSGTATPAPISETQASYSAQTPGFMNGIVGLWHLDEAVNSTTAIDSSGNNNNGTAQDMIFGSSGVIGSGAKFDTTQSGSIQLGALSNYNSAKTTECAWINPSENSQVNGRIVSNYEDGADGSDFMISGASTPSLNYVQYIAGSQVTHVASSAVIPFNQWSHVCMTGNSVTPLTQLYINGVAIESTHTYSPVNYNFFCIGKRGCGDNQFIGNMDEVGIWNRDLSATEILELYRRGSNRVKFQVRKCAAADCSDDAANANWKGPDNSNQTYFSELNNNVQVGSPTMTFANFAALSAFNTPTRQYFQYRAIMESDDTSTRCNYGGANTWCSPELQSVSVGPDHFDATLKPTISNKIVVNYDTLSTLVETLGTDGCSSGALYNLSPDNSTWYHWTGAAWGIADGTVAKADPVATITNNLTAFATQFGQGVLYFKVFLQTSGTSACAIDSLSISGTR